MLNLSISTVSRALKDHPDISKHTIKRVKEISESLEYAPNANAIHLKTQNSRLFTVLVPSLSTFYYDSFIAGIEEECRKDNYTLMILQNADDIDIEKANLKLCRHNRVSGIFACMNPENEDFQEYYKVLDNNIPLLFYDKVPENVQFNKISIDDTEAGKLAASAIKKKKGKNVLAIFGNAKMSITNRRHIAFKEIMEQSNIAVTYVHAHSSKEAEALACQYLEQKKIDSIMCMSDEILIGAMLGIQKLEHHFKKPINIVCMSEGFFPTIYYHDIAYVETSGYQLAKKAYETMHKIIKEKEAPKEFMVTPNIIEQKKS